MKLFLVFILFILSLTSLKISNIKPEFILIFVIYIGLKLKESKALFLGVFLGLIEDGLSYFPLGLYALTKGISGFLASKIGKNFAVDNFLSFAIIVSILAFFENLFFLGIFSLFPYEKEGILKILLLQPVITFLASSIFFYFMNKYEI